MRENLKNKKGITLVSLVITIIVLIILAGVSINMTLGENGIITIAKRAKENIELAKIEEETSLNELYEQIGKEGETSGEISYDAIAKLVEFKEKIATAITNKGIETSKDSTADVMAENIQKIQTASESSTVTYVTLNDGNTVPVPKGFFYVGGNLSTGVIISDEEADKYDVNTDKTTHDYAPNLKGNQFVWIPCSIDDYHKTTTFTKATSDSTWGTKAQNAYYDTSTNSAEETQIRKYGGFYVARYEAGTSEIEGIDFSSAYTCESTWQSPNYLYTKVTKGNVTSKANEIPWYHANYTTAVEMSRRMYANSNYVSSGLITGTMWDVMITVMNNKTSCSLSSSNWGNYYDYSITDARGKYTYVSDVSSSSRGSNTAWADNTNGTNTKTTISSTSYWKLLSTGASNSTQKMHIYDVAGNMSEWTQEMAFNSNKAEWFVLRGGASGASINGQPASFRTGYVTDAAFTFYGFRVALYIK